MIMPRKLELAVTDIEVLLLIQTAVDVTPSPASGNR